MIVNWIVDNKKDIWALYQLLRASGKGIILIQITRTQITQPYQSKKAIRLKFFSLIIMRA